MITGPVRTGRPGSGSQVGTWSGSSSEPTSRSNALHPLAGMLRTAAEAYNGMNGFKIGGGTSHVDVEQNDARDAEDLLRVLEDGRVTRWRYGQLQADAHRLSNALLRPTTASRADTRSRWS